MEKGLGGFGERSEVARNKRILPVGLLVLVCLLLMPSANAIAETPVCGEGGASPYVLEQARASVVRIGLTDASGGFVRGT